MLLGLETLPRLIAAHSTKKITKQARFQYRHAIVAALAVAGSRGDAWPQAYDSYLRLDPSWLFPRSQLHLGNWHNDFQLERFVLPFLYAAIAALPKERAHTILDAALDETMPRKLPMAFFALPLLKAHWRAEYLPRAIQAMRQAEDARGDFIDSGIRQQFRNDLYDLGLVEDELLERYKTGHARHVSELNGFVDDKARLLKRAKELLPAPQLKRFEKNFNVYYSP